ncbi:hypothetical protein I6F26_30460 [Ensifer sp. IC3342]|nr:hypothetical protein [Ensifer sp. BRP08]MCA1450831.1 hypothetical protein [Ensifer sp. IC3342]
MLIAIAETIGSKSGPRYMIWNAWELLSVEQMHVGLLVFAFLGHVISVILTELERKLVPWKKPPDDFPRLTVEMRPSRGDCNSSGQSRP